MANIVNWLASRIKQDESNRLVSDLQITTWNGKADADHNHDDKYIPIDGTINNFNANIFPANLGVGMIGNPTNPINMVCANSFYVTKGGSESCTIGLDSLLGIVFRSSDKVTNFGSLQANKFSKSNLEWLLPDDSGTVALTKNIPVIPESLKNPNTLSVQLNGGTATTYDGSVTKSINITPAGIGAAAASHTHIVANITDFPTAMKNPASIKVQLNSGTTEGTNQFTYDGSAAKTINITPSGIGAAAASHTHTIANITNLQSTLDGKAAKSHTHGDADITSISASKITGTISIDHLPQGALDRLVRVDDDTARFKLTAANVQLGDTVKVKSSGLMYYVVDESKLGEESGYEPYTAGSATSVPWSGVTGKPSTFAPSAHTHAIANVTGLQTALDGKAASSHNHTKAQITDFPTTMKNPTAITITLNGGTTEGTNKFTYDGSAVKSINITPSGIGAAASSHTHTIANVTGLQSALDGKAASSHSHAIANVTGLQSALDGKAASSHTHTIANVTNLQTTLDSKVSNAPTLVTNWNSATNAGYYYAAKGATNAPEATLGYFGQVCKSTTSIMQTIFPEGASGDIKQYMRRGTISGSTVTWETNWACITYALS